MPFILVRELSLRVRYPRNQSSMSALRREPLYLLSKHLESIAESGLLHRALTPSLVLVA